VAEVLTILQEREGAAVLRLNRPDKRNALSGALREEIVRQLSGLEKNDAVRAVVLTGAAPAFCAGFDRSEFAGGGSRPAPASLRCWCAGARLPDECMPIV
jgi:enoyl-CoA hydratase/carnithine racemase